MLGNKTIPFLVPDIPALSAVQSRFEAIDRSKIYSNFGPLVKELEGIIASSLFSGAGHVVTVANATLGLILAMKVVKREGARYALMPSFTFPATPLAAMWCGLTPLFLDIRPGDWALDESELRTALRQLRGDVAVVVPYATFGTGIDLSFYAELHCSGVPVVVDAAPSAGSFSAGTHFGKDFPAPVVYSLHATKPFGVGEGGFVYSADRKVIEAIRAASNFGFDRNRISAGVGLNAKLSEYAAAVGLAAFEALPSKTSERRRLYDRYVAEFSASGLLQEGWVLQEYTGDTAPQFLSVLCPLARSRREVTSWLRRCGIETRSYFSPPCHLQPAFASARCESLSMTEAISSRILSLPLWTGMTEADVARVAEALRSLGRCPSPSAPVSATTG